MFICLRASRLAYPGFDHIQDTAFRFWFFVSSESKLTSAPPKATPFVMAQASLEVLGNWHPVTAMLQIWAQLPSTVYLHHICRHCSCYFTLPRSSLRRLLPVVRNLHETCTCNSTQGCMTGFFKTMIRAHPGFWNRYWTQKLCHYTKGTHWNSCSSLTRPHLRHIKFL